jgi:hypothetical protein
MSSVAVLEFWVLLVVRTYVRTDNSILADFNYNLNLNNT